VSVYVTAASPAEAERVARHVLERRLAACANAWPIRSWYWWEGQLEQAEEVALLLKTRAALVPALEREVRAVHSYSVPCVVAWPIAAGSAPYLAWVEAEARGAGERLR
jgi:periplasmic divalent cation tolerance protein